MHRRFGVIALTVFALLIGNVPAAAIQIKIPGFPPEIAVGAPPAGLPVGELPDRRTRNSTTSRAANGKFTTTIAGGPINYRDKQGHWQPIDSNLTSANDGGYNWRNSANAFGVRFKRDLVKDFARIDVNGKSFTLSLDSATPGRGSPNGPQILYRNVLSGVDLRYDVISRGLKETLLLASADAPTHYRFVLTPPSQIPVDVRRSADGAWNFFMPAIDDPALVLPVPTASDSPTLAGAVPEEQRVASLEVTKSNGKFLIDLSLDSTWLHAPQRHFPILLDPTVTIQPSTQDTYFHGNVGTDAGQMGTATYLRIGDSSAHWDWSAVQFDLSAVPPGASITAATLGLYYDAHYIGGTTPDGNGTTHTLEAHRMTAAWSPTSTTSQLGWDPTVLSNLTMTINGTKRWLNWDVTAAATSWYAGTQPNYGLLLKRNPDTLNASGPLPLSSNYATDASLVPKIDISYTTDGVGLNQPTTLHSNGADLTWSKYTGASSGAPFQKYEVHRSATKNFTPSSSTLLTTVTDISQTSFRDTTAAANGTFYYNVVANSSGSNWVKVTLPADGQATKTLQPGPGGSQDTYIAYYNNLTNCATYGGSDHMTTGNDLNTISRPLLFYNLNDIPAGSSISSATLSLWHYNGTPVATSASAHKVAHSWNEGTGLSSPGTCTGDGATWYETTGGVKWTTQGGDFDPANVGTVSIAANEAARWHDFNVTSIAQQWGTGSAPNLGVLIKLDAGEAPGATNEVKYYSSNYTVTPTLRPKLSVTYSDGSHAVGPSVSVSAPAPGAMIAGSSVSLKASASDDRRVDKVEFYVDGGLVGSSTTAPFSVNWNTAGATNASHSITAKAYDDAGNTATSIPVSVTVNNNPPPTTTVNSPGSTVTGTVNVTASAAAASGLSVSKVEFYFDNTLFGTSTVAPYTASWNTLDGAQPAFDGAHNLATKVYDSSGLVTSSTAVTTTAANTASTKYKGTFAANTAVPLTMDYDPAAGSQLTYPVKVTVTNTSAVTWSNTDTYLRYRWYSPDATPVITDGPNVALPASLGPGASSSQIQVTVTPPTLPDGVDAAQYNLRIDLFDSAGNTLFSTKGNQPLDNPVIVNKVLKAALGLERYYNYVGQDVGAGMQSLVNIANGNSLLRWQPFNTAGRGMATVMGLTYNSREEHSDSPAGDNFSLSISTLSRFGEPIDIHPNNADTIAGRANRWISFVDGDGTPHKFTGAQHADGTIYWMEPTGVHLYLRQYSTTDTTRWWAFTRPDRVTFFYNQAGYPTYVTDRNGNAISFTLTAVAPADDPGGPKFHITQVVDAAGQGGSPAPNRGFNIAYYVKADNVKSHVRGKIKSMTDHMGHALDFFYYDDGNLLRAIQRGGSNADGSFLADRSFVFTYTTSSGAGPAISDPVARANPDPKTPNESTRLFSVRDPNGKETSFSYITSGIDKWKLLTLTDRAAAVTSYAYDNVNQVTTVAAPTPAGQMARTTRYAYDANGKPTTITDPLGRLTQLQWTADFTVSQITEPGGAITKYAYNNNGYMTDRYDELNNHTVLSYSNPTVDANDASGKWVAGRTIPHVSDLSTKTDPKGSQWQFAYDTKGNILQVTDPLNNISKNSYNPDGTTASTTDALNHVTTYANYDANGKSTRVTDAKGNVTTFGYNDDGLLIWVQDARHQANSGGDPRQYRSYSDYDSFNRLGRQSTPKLTGDASHLIWTDTAYDANGNVVWSMAPHYGAQDSLNGDKATFSYDVMDRQTLRTIPDFSADPSGERTQTDYDIAGRVIKVTEPMGVATGSIANDYASLYSYDGLDRTTARTRYQVDPSTGAIQKTMVTQYCYNAAGDKVSMTLPNAGPAAINCAAPTIPYTTKFTYDADHRTLTQTDPLGNVRSKAYDANGNVITATDPAGKQTTYSYDKLNRVTQTTEPFDGTVTPARTLTQRLEYDAAGNKSREISMRAYDASADKTTFTNYVTRFQYDELNRLVRTDLPIDGTYTTQYYVHQQYDGVGNVVMSSLPTTTVDPTLVPATQKTTVGYFDTGWVQTSKDPANPVVHFDYLAQGWQSTRLPEDGSGNLDTAHQMFWSYFADGQVQRKGDIHGDPVTYKYNANDLMTTADGTGGVYDKSQAPNHLEIAYDTLGQISKSRQKKTTDPNFTFTAYTSYDLDGNLIDSEQNGAETPAGALVSAGRKLHEDYNGADWLIDQIDYGTKPDKTDDQKAVNTYLSTGWAASREQDGTDVNGNWVKKQTTNWSYFDNGKLKTMGTLNGSAATLESHTVSYIAGGIYNNGNRTQDIFTLKGPNTSASCYSTSCTATYSYDPRDRATQENNGYGTTTKYDLDGSGNVLNEYVNNTLSKTNTYTGDRLQRVVQGGTTSLYWYTTDGNLDCVTNGAGSQANCSPSSDVPPSANLLQDYAYDPLNRLSSYRAYSGGSVSDSASYVYDALDRTILEKETHPGQSEKTTTLSYRGLSRDVVSEQQSNASGPITTKDYAYDAYGQRLSMTTTPNGQASTTYTYGYNVHDSTSLLIDPNGGSKASYGYRPYGQLDNTAPGATNTLTQGDQSTTDPINAYRYSAKRFDSGSQTIDTGARRFGPEQRFLQQDLFHGALADLALGNDPISQNRYALAGGNPLSFIEWDGHMVTADGGGSAPPDGRSAVGPDDRPSNGIVYYASSANQHKQDSKPIWQQGWDAASNAFNQAKEKVQQAGDWVYDHSEEIAAVSGTLAVATMFIPGVDVISPALFAISAGASVISASKEARQGNYGAAALDMLGAIPGFGAGKAVVKDLALVGRLAKDSKAVTSLVGGVSKEGGSANLVFRGGSRTADNLTPRLKDVEGSNPGLSTWRTPEQAMAGGSAKAQAIDVNRLRSLRAFEDEDGHVALRPSDPEALEGWAATRGTGTIHPYTRELLDAVVGEVR